MRFVHRGSHMKELKKRISIPKQQRLLLLGHEEELCPPIASSCAGPLTRVCLQFEKRDISLPKRNGILFTSSVINTN